jgi:RHS repeat-associated protein
MNLGYTGKPYDTATGLYNYGYRDYKPQAARFTTVDPIRDGRNWYAYVNNDPVNWVDLWGLECIVTDVMVAAMNISSTHTDTRPLSELVNTENLANIIYTYSSFLDPATSEMVIDISANAVKDLLDNVYVALGVPVTPEVSTLFDRAGLPSTTEAVTVGNTVYVFGNMATGSNGKVNDLDDANLLAHEAIHSLQTHAAGSTDIFLTNYFSGNTDYYSKPEEIAAYSFGPEDPNATLSTGLLEPILNELNNQGWFR